MIKIIDFEAGSFFTGFGEGQPVARVGVGGLDTAPVGGGDAGSGIVAALRYSTPYGWLEGSNSRIQSRRSLNSDFSYSWLNGETPFQSSVLSGPTE
jgi:hypothetical protein